MISSVHYSSVCGRMISACVVMLTISQSLLCTELKFHLLAACFHRDLCSFYETKSLLRYICEINVDISQCPLFHPLPISYYFSSS